MKVVAPQLLALLTGCASIESAPPPGLRRVFGAR